VVVLNLDSPYRSNSFLMKGLKKQLNPKPRKDTPEKYDNQ
jgi:hypothetical protein